ncbi:hypothetical protein BKA62DRAFT_681303 [Auriculariales sp. MPI-PUGE-AT-0066]|nr:hypothetical protein BKA62DRAFT_681303 [Auriculariales sp. MPI-PUGE-AT-0066]
MGAYSLIDADQGGHRKRRPAHKHKNAQLDGLLRSVTGSPNRKRKRSLQLSSPAPSGWSDAVDRGVSRSTTPKTWSQSTLTSEERPRKKARAPPAIMPDWLSATLRGDSLPDASTTDPQASSTSPPRALIDRWAKVHAPRPLYPSQLAAVLVEHETNAPTAHYIQPVDLQPLSESEAEKSVAFQLISQPFAPYGSPGPGFSFVSKPAPALFEPAFAFQSLPHHEPQQHSSFKYRSPQFQDRIDSSIVPSRVLREEFEISTPEPDSSYEDGMPTSYLVDNLPPYAVPVTPTKLDSLYRPISPSVRSLSVACCVKLTSP